MSASETTELLHRGLDDDHEYPLFGGATEQVSAGAHPRTVIRAAQAALAGDDAKDGDASVVEELMQRASEVGRSETMAILELIGIGHPVSAHDPELLQRLRWSRPYAQRVLSKLEDEGLLRSIPERSTDRPGRPRKLYEPMLARSA